MNDLIAIETRPNIVTQAEAIALRARRADQNPALVYLRAMTPKARRVQANALNTHSPPDKPRPDLTSVNWELIEYQHAQAIRLINPSFTARKCKPHAKRPEGRS